MAIDITQPFGFNAQLPNFERDVINAMDYSNNNLLYLTSEEKSETALKYDVGHIVYDTYTKMHYVWLGETDGWGLPSASMAKVKFSDVNSANETLYLDNVERNLATGIGNMVYAPVDSEPADWAENYGEYYTFDSSTKTYVVNTSSVYNSSVTYYVVLFRGM